MSLFTVRHALFAPTRRLLSLGCVLTLASALAGCALDAQPEGEQSTSQDSAELALDEVEGVELVTPEEEQQQDAPGGEVGDDSSDPTPDPWHSTDPTPDPWDEVDDGMGQFVAPLHGR